jgi:hypothetical protein
VGERAVGDGAVIFIDALVNKQAISVPELQTGHSGPTSSPGQARMQRRSDLALAAGWARRPSGMLDHGFPG